MGELMGKRNRPGKREREKANQAVKLGRLVQALAIETQEGRKAQLRSEIALLELRQAASNERKLPQRTSNVPVPQSYLEEVRRKREDAHKVSGFERMRAKFVSGGAPGSGKRS